MDRGSATRSAKWRHAGAGGSSVKVEGAARATQATGRSADRSEKTAGIFPVSITSRSQQAGSPIASCPPRWSGVSPPAAGGQQASAITTPVTVQRRAR